MVLAWVIASFAFLLVVTIIVGLWLASATRRGIRHRLGDRARVSPEKDTGLLRADRQEAESSWKALISRIPLWSLLTALADQGGYSREASDVLLLMGTFALVGGAGGWFRTGGIAWGVLSALLAGSLPVFYLLYKRHRRLERFEQQFPDALDMMTRSMRAGHALSGSIQLVAEEMPDPVGQEFSRVSEEIRVGLDPSEALSRLRSRLPTEDTLFFCTAISIQRSAGGNLTEILDRLSEVIRERLKLLSYARVLSAQHRSSAIFVGSSPVFFAILFQFLDPGFFDPLLESPVAPYLIALGLVLEAIGFLVIWRIAKIRV